ncbi:MAG: hypothetical protein M1357_00955 [Candidatus Marsarchaeota archaeon]|nr:hypothetical protein [Candidatus Marsarchaeota archaeon]
MKRRRGGQSLGFVAIPYSKSYNRALARPKKGSKYIVRIVEKDTLEAKLYFKRGHRLPSSSVEN